MPTDRVLLLHGIAAGVRSMRTMERALAAAGYDTLTLAYPSCRQPLRELVRLVHACGHWTRRDGGRLHLVTYSMGGLLARAAIAQGRPPDLGRVVMMGPPNTGSEIADLLVGFPPYRRIFGPAGAELVTRPPPELVRLLGEVDYPLGIVAGDRFLDPLGWLLIPGPNDGRVSVERTRLPGMADHVTVHATHHGMVRNRRVIGHAIGFLRDGRFPPDARSLGIRSPGVRSPE